MGGKLVAIAGPVAAMACQPRLCRVRGVLVAPAFYPVLSGCNNSSGQQGQVGKEQIMQ